MDTNGIYRVGLFSKKCKIILLDLGFALPLHSLEKGVKLNLYETHVSTAPPGPQISSWFP
jgi:hypothetical protein